MDPHAGLCRLGTVSESAAHKTALQKGMGAGGLMLPLFFPQAENADVHSVRLLGRSSQRVRWAT